MLQRAGEVGDRSEYRDSRCACYYCRHQLLHQVRSALLQAQIKLILWDLHATLSLSARRRRSSVNFGGGWVGAIHFCPKTVYEKLTKCPHFTWYLPERLSKFPNFYICLTNIFPEFGGGERAPSPRTRYNKIRWFTVLDHPVGLYEYHIQRFVVQ